MTKKLIARVFVSAGSITAMAAVLGAGAKWLG